MTPLKNRNAASFWSLAQEQSAKSLLRQSDDYAEEKFWQDFAPSYDEKSPLAACADELIEDIRSLIKEPWHMLEIGAGTGAFTRRLASALSRITIVEPSRAMQKEFRELWDRPDFVKILMCKWEDAPDLKADMVFGANAFYRIKDIGAALTKMNTSARHRVALVQTVGRPHANPLSVTLEGETVERERADALCDVLADLGIQYQRRDYDVSRPSGPSRVALIHWPPVPLIE